ncbi:MAG: PRC-barrel domain-containing protein [Candidatus Micrarchaeia archaeon]
MPKYVIAKQLAGKKIITSDGEDLGRLVDIKVAEVGGRLQTLVIEPSADSPVASRLQRDDQGHSLVPYDSVMAVSDFVIVDKKTIPLQG